MFNRFGFQANHRNTLSLPRPRTAGNGAASGAALGYLDSLIAQRSMVAIPESAYEVVTIRGAQGALTAAQVSLAIDALKAAPFKVRNAAPGAKAPAELVPEGFYIKNGEVFRVRSSKQDPSRRYATILVVTAGEKGRFEYKSGAIRDLRLEHKLTLAEAKVLGHQYGICIICGAHLTDENSVANGIGPVCATRI